MEMNSYRKCSGIKKAKTRCESLSAGSKPLGEESFNILKKLLSRASLATFGCGYACNGV